MPLRDDRRGKRATLRGDAPLRPDFRSLLAPGVAEQGSGLETLSTVGPSLREGATNAPARADAERQRPSGTSPTVPTPAARSASAPDAASLRPAPRGTRERESHHIDAGKLAGPASPERATPSRDDEVDIASPHAPQHDDTLDVSPDNAHDRPAIFRNPFQRSKRTKLNKVTAATTEPVEKGTFVIRTSARSASAFDATKRAAGIEAASIAAAPVDVCSTESASPAPTFENVNAGPVEPRHYDSDDVIGFNHEGDVRKSGAEGAAGGDIVATPSVAADAANLPERSRSAQRGIVTGAICLFSGAIRRFFAPLQFQTEAVSTADIPPTVLERSFADELESLLPISPQQSTAKGEVHDGVPVVSPVAERWKQIPEEEQTTALVIRTVRPPCERIAPLTRLPLRPQTTDITWPALLDNLTRSLQTPLARHELLDELARSFEPILASEQTALCRAYREEDAPGRVLALSALMRRPSSSHVRSSDVSASELRAIFADALQAGSDDERSLAIDGLVESGDRAQLVPGLHDRVDALAAKAALAYVDSHVRAEYRIALAPFIDASRIETLLVLLAGIVE